MIDKIKSILAKLKEAKSMHHAILPLILGYIGLIIHPIVCLAFSSFSIGNYFGREQAQAENRGFDIFDKSTWRLELFEVTDFLTPAIVATVYIIISIIKIL